MFPLLTALLLCPQESVQVILEAPDGGVVTHDLAAPLAAPLPEGVAFVWNWETDEDVEGRVVEEGLPRMLFLRVEGLTSSSETKWIVMDDDGNLSGSLAHLFEQAMKIEGTNKSQGKHPAGVIISKHKLADACPMTVDKLGNPIVAFEMTALETQGHVKFDVLGIDLLSKIMEIAK